MVQGDVSCTSACLAAAAATCTDSLIGFWLCAPHLTKAFENNLKLWADHQRPMLCFPLDPCDRSTYQKLVADGTLEPAADVPVPNIPMDLKTAVSQGLVRGLRAAIQERVVASEDQAAVSGCHGAPRYNWRSHPVLHKPWASDSCLHSMADSLLP